MPIHAGAASKLLLAYMDAPALEQWLSRPLTAYTSRTITDPKRLRSEVVRIRRQGWAQDNGENAPGVQAFAAPIFARGGEMLAALSIPFLAGTDAARMEEIRLAAIAAAQAISGDMPA
jgi:DNA-binding IclR family transcriptional regulator